MGCDDVKRVIYFYLDGQLGSNKQQAIVAHLSLCHDCDHRTVILKRLRGFLRKRLGLVSAPERFKIRLSRSLRAFQAF